MALPAAAAERPRFSDVAAALKSQQAAELDAVNEVILEHLDSGVPLIPTVAAHLIKAGGKRLRPLLCLASAEICGGGGAQPRLLAAAVELIHAATLLHDDVVDDSALRRGLKTANVVFGNKESVLVGDFLFARAFELMVKTGSLRVLDILSQASCTISEGEVLQLETQNVLTTTKGQYIDVITAKTAALFGAATEAGAEVSTAPYADVAAMATFGRCFGISYQLIDDALDYSATAEAMGKTAGDDFREGKMTLPVILAVGKARNDDERAFWQRTIADKQQQAGDFERACELMARDGAIDASITLAEDYARRAMDALSGFAPSPTRDSLLSLAAASVSRRT